jgi:hypothetical protein
MSASPLVLVSKDVDNGQTEARAWLNINKTALAVKHRKMNESAHVPAPMSDDCIIRGIPEVVARSQGSIAII